MREPCPLPLVALRGDETCPRCGRPAREHRGHPSYVEPTAIIGVDLATEPDRTVTTVLRQCPWCFRHGCTNCNRQPWEETMTETTEPTREQIVEAIDGLVNDTDAPQWMKDLEDDGTQAEWFTAVLRMALRTLDAEAKLAAMTERAERLQRHFDEAAPEHNLPALLDLYAERERAATDRAEKAETQLGAAKAAVNALRATVDILETDARAIRDAAMTHARWFMRGGETAAPAIERMAMALRGATERAEKAERELADVSDECATLRTDHVRMRSALVSAEARAEKAERECTEAWDVHGMAVARAEKAERERNEAEDEAAAHNAAATQYEKDIADLRTKLADAERRIAELSPPTTDERLDCESSSLLLLSTWARRVMMREKNRDKGVPEESVEELLAMARAELSEARCAIEENAPTDDILAELGDAAAIIAFAMREVESRRNR